MHWSTALYQAVESFDGGARSFPLASEAAFASKHGYEPPNKEYKELFASKKSILRLQPNQNAQRRSAGWLISDPADASVCKPVFVAHSVLSAIWLLRETLADDALSNDGWNCLVCAAQSLAEEGVAEPPSAQKTSLRPVSQRAKRQPPAAQILSSPKRARTEAPELPQASPPASTLASNSETQLDERLAEEQRATTTVTNRNRDAERKRIKDREAALIERRLDLGLVALDAKAANEEVGAYVAVPAKDQAVISWLFKQNAVDRYRRKTDFYSAVKMPYLKACDFLTKACALGSPLS